jgi:predicted kinase
MTKTLFLVQMAGHPGVGKSALAERLAAATGAIVVDKDRFVSAALDSGVEAGIAGAMAYENVFIAADLLLSAGNSVILDSPAAWIEIRRKRQELADRYGVRYLIIECVLEDEEEHRRRVASRAQLHALHPTSLEGIDLAFERPGTAPLWEPHLSVDMGVELEDCVRVSVEYVASGDDAAS